MNEIDEIVINTHKSLEMKKINDKLYLSNKQINILNNYDIDYENKSIEELIYEIEEILNDSYEESIELEELSKELSEFNYYHNTKK